METMTPAPFWMVGKYQLDMCLQRNPYYLASLFPE